MAKESATLIVRLSPKLKTQFEQMCDDNEISMSDKLREIIANLVRNHARQTTKTNKEES